MSRTVDGSGFDWGCDVPIRAVCGREGTVWGREGASLRRADAVRRRETDVRLDPL